MQQAQVLQCQKVQRFTTTVDNTSYQYVTNSDITITPSSGVYKFSSVPIYEGTCYI